MGFLHVGAFAVRSGDVGRKRFGTFAGARELSGDAQRFEEVVVRRAVVEREAVAIEEGRELHQLVEAVGAGRREGRVFRAVVADALAADVDVPRQAARGMMADDLVQRVVFVRPDRQLHLDDPVIVRDARRDLGLRIPGEPLRALDAAVEIAHRAAGADGDLIIRVGLGFDQHLDHVAIPQRAVVLLRRADVQLLARMLVAADGEVEIVAAPRRLDRRAEDRLASRLQLAQAHGRARVGVHPRVLVELPINHDRLAWRADEPQHGQRAAHLAKLRALVAQALEEVVDQREPLAENARRIGFRFRLVEQRERGVGLVLFLLHRLPVRLAIVEERVHFRLGGAVEQAHIFAEQRVRIRVLAAPIQALREVDREVIEAQVLLRHLLPDAQPDVLALRAALGRVDARAERMRRERRQIPAAIGEGIVLENDDRVRGLRHPALAERANLRLLLRLVVHRSATAHDAHDDIRLQLLELQRWQRIDAVGAIHHLLVGMRPAHFLRDAVHEAPDVIRREAAVVALRRILSRAPRALADRDVTVRRHHGDHVHFVVIEERADVAHGLGDQLLVRVAKMVVCAALVAPLAAVERIPVGMRREDFRVIRHRIHAVSGLDAIRIAQAEAHRPAHHRFAVGGEADVEAAEGKIRPQGFVELRQRDGFRRGQHLAQFTRQIPANSEPHEKTAHRVERTALVLRPDFDGFRLDRGRCRIGQAGVARDESAILVDQQIRHAPQRAGDFVPLTLRAAVHDLRVPLRPRFDGCELRVLTEQHQPVLAADHAKSPVLQVARRDLQRVGVRAATDEHMHDARARRRDDGQPRAGDFLHRAPQLVRREPLRARGLLRNDDLRARLAILDEERGGGGVTHRGNEERQEQGEKKGQRGFHGAAVRKQMRSPDKGEGHSFAGRSFSGNSPSGVTSVTSSKYQILPLACL